MDIHKPKPWHGLREFLKEYVIIVVGVLTALGAEAVVQNLHEARLSAEAKATVRDELNVNITALEPVAKFEPCVSKRMDEIEALLDRADGGEPFTPPGNIGGAVTQSIQTQRWEAATAGGRTSLLSSDEQRAFGRVYSILASISHREDRVRDVWFRLRVLGHVRRLTPEMIYDQRVALSTARDVDNALRRDISEATFYASKVGVKGDAQLLYSPDRKSLPSLPVICQPLARSGA